MVASFGQHNVTLLSLEVFLNKLPPRDPNATRVSVARVNYTIEIEGVGTIVHRGVHLIKKSNGGIFLSSPGKPTTHGTYMEYQSITGGLSEQIRKVAVTTYRDALRMEQQSEALANAPAAPSEPSALGGEAGVSQRVERLCSIDKFLATARSLESELAGVSDAAVVVVDDHGQPVSRTQLLQKVARMDPVLAYHVVACVSGVNMTMHTAVL